MSTHVRFRCGDMTLYLDARAVHAVTGVEADTRGDLVEWQGQAVRRLDLNGLLGQSGGGTQALLLTAGGEMDDELLMLTVDSIDNVLSLQPADFRALPPVAGRFSQVFDAAIAPGEGLAPGLRLRYPLPEELTSRQP